VTQHRTAVDFCRSLGVTRQAVWNAVRAGRIPAPTRIGPRVFVWFEVDYVRALRLWKSATASRAAGIRSRCISKAKYRVTRLKLRLADAKAILAALTKKR